MEALLEDPELARRELGLRPGEDLPSAIARRIAEIILRGEPADSLRAADRFLDRYDGPVKREIEKRLLSQTLNEIVVIQAPEGAGDPELPREVTEIEEMEEKAEREREERMELSEGDVEPLRPIR